MRNWTPRAGTRQEAIFFDLHDLYAQHERDDALPRGNRGSFYDLRPSGIGRGVTYRKPTREHPRLGAWEAGPDQVQEVLVLARRAGQIPEDWVADDRAPEALLPFTVDSAGEGADWLDSALSIARLDRQAGQPVFVEVWCEAEGLGPRLARQAGEFGVPVYPAGGFAGLKPKRAAAERIASREVPTVALQVGDYDKHGRWAFSAQAEDIACWVPQDAQPGGPWLYRSGAESLVLEDPTGRTRLTVVRLAVTERQVADGLVEVDEDGKAEADQVPVRELDRIVTEALREWLPNESAQSGVLAAEMTLRDDIRALLAGRWTA